MAQSINSLGLEDSDSATGTQTRTWDSGLMDLNLIVSINTVMTHAFLACCRLPIKDFSLHFFYLFYWEFRY